MRHTGALSSVIFQIILPEINLLFFEMNTTDVGYFIAISNSVISSNKNV